MCQSVNHNKTTNKINRTTVAGSNIKKKQSSNSSSLTKSLDPSIGESEFGLESCWQGKHPSIDIYNDSRLVL